MDDRTAFLELSAVLTGLYQIVTDVEERSLYEKLADEYGRKISAVFHDGLAKLLGRYKVLAGVTPKPPLDDLLLEKLKAEQDFKDNELVARQIVNIWYFSQFKPAADPAAPFLDGGFYEDGKVWPIIRAHPIGFSHEPHGYWKDKPAASSD